MAVYFIACGGFIKVGFSDDPEKRCKNLFRGTSFYTAPRAAHAARGTQELLGYIEGSKQTERLLHQALDAYCAGCEWFVDESDLRKYLLSLTDDMHAGPFRLLNRAAGPAWETLPRDEMGGRNYALYQSKGMSA